MIWPQIISVSVTQSVTPFIYHVWNFQSMESWSKIVIFQYEKFAEHIKWM